MKKLFKSHNLAIIIIAFGAVFILFAPAILLSPAFHSFFDVSKGGDLGNAIGGLTAPIVGFLGAILIYLGFREQVKTNEYQDLSIKRNESLKNFDLLLEWRNQIKNSFEKLSVTTKDGTIEKGYWAAEIFRYNHSSNSKEWSISDLNRMETELFNIVIDFESLIDTMQEVKLETKHYELLARIIGGWYYKNLYVIIDALVNDDKFSSKIQALPDYFKDVCEKSDSVIMKGQSSFLIGYWKE